MAYTLAGTLAFGLSTISKVGLTVAPAVSNPSGLLSRCAVEGGISVCVDGIVLLGQSF